jgi:hypothetical protein
MLLRVYILIVVVAVRTDCIFSHLVLFLVKKCVKIEFAIFLPDFEGLAVKNCRNLNFPPMSKKTCATSITLKVPMTRRNIFESVVSRNLFAGTAHFFKESKIPFWNVLLSTYFEIVLFCAKAINYWTNIFPRKKTNDHLCWNWKEMPV